MFTSKGKIFIAIAIILFTFNFKIVPTQGNTFISQNQEYKLAINWQPAFCETRPYLTECKKQNQTSFEATNFTLHGLWPESIYCGVSQSIVNTDRDNKWSELPPIKLSINTHETKKQSFQ
jgi:ribonuclease T2